MPKKNNVLSWLLLLIWTASYFSFPFFILNSRGIHPGFIFAAPIVLWLVFLVISQQKYSQKKLVRINTIAYVVFTILWLLYLTLTDTLQEFGGLLHLLLIAYYFASWLLQLLFLAIFFAVLQKIHERKKLSL